MSTIDDEQQARRLAVAAVADVALYGEGESEEDVAQDLAEARAHFRERVAPALHALFEEEAARLPSLLAKPSASDEAAAAALLADEIVGDALRSGATGSDLERELAQARALFERDVGKEHHALFDAAVARSRRR